MQFAVSFTGPTTSVREQAIQPRPHPNPHQPTHLCSRALCISLSFTADAYYGQNTKIRETLNSTHRPMPSMRPVVHYAAPSLTSHSLCAYADLILRSPQEWQTQVGLPFVKIEGKHTALRPITLHTICFGTDLVRLVCLLRHDRRVGRAPLRRPPPPARAVRGRVSHADIPAPVRTANSNPIPIHPHSPHTTRE